MDVAESTARVGKGVVDVQHVSAPDAQRRRHDGPHHCHVLVDHQLEEMVGQGEIVEQLFGVRARFRHDSAIQPSSIDLHVGVIFIPEGDQGVGGPHRPRMMHSLAPGHTAVVETKEMLRIPDDVAGMGFPLSRMSSRGLLMTNPGHVDPGYHGRLTFTAINMGREPFELRDGDPIVTLVLLQLDAPVTAGYTTRYADARPPSIMAENLERLSADFLDVERRAQEVVQREEARTRRWSVVVPAVVIALGIVSSVVANHFQRQASIGDELRRLDRRMSVIESTVDSRSDVEELQDRLDELEDAVE